MKKIGILSTLAAGLLVAASGCLKDKGFENQNYGIQITEVKAVSFPQAAASPLAYGLDVSATPQVIPGLVNLAIESNSNAEADLPITISNTTAADVAAYNAANPTTPVEILPSALWSVPTTITIPAGAKTATADITVSNTTSLDPNKFYAVGLTITNSPAGYQIAANQKKILIIFSVKNRYDGIYRLKAYANLGGNTSAPYLVTTACGYGLELETTGPNTVRMSNQPLWRANAFYDGFCNVNFDFAFDLATDKVSSVTSWSSCPPNAGIAVNFPATSAPAGSPANLGVPGYNSRYDAATRTIYVAMGLNNNPNWVVVDTLIYCGPR